MHNWAHRDELRHRIETLVLQAKFSYEWQLLIDEFLAEVAQIEVDDWPVWTLDRAPSVEFLDESL